MLELLHLLAKTFEAANLAARRRCVVDPRMHLRCSLVNELAGDKGDALENKLIAGRGLQLVEVRQRMRNMGRPDPDADLHGGTRRELARPFGELRPRADLLRNRAGVLE